MEAFERFWQAYPKRQRASANPKHPAYTIWTKLVRSVDPEKIIGAAKQYADECRRERIFGTEKVAMARTWLYQRRFEDYAAPEKPQITDEAFEAMKSRYERKVSAQV